jgi:dihydroorotate dehydrogenase electron transfer subunit
MQLLPTAKSPHELLTKGVSPFNINTVKVTDDGSEGFRGLATDLIVNHIDWAHQLFACGPLPMYKTMAQMTELKDKPVQISLEVRMACGLGVCYGCTVKTNNGLKQVCRDGPVFKLDDIVWDEVANI